jgi:hypothetical protein
VRVKTEVLLSFARDQAGAGLFSQYDRNSLKPHSFFIGNDFIECSFDIGPMNCHFYL